MDDVVIQLANISKNYGNNKVLDDISLEFKKGTIYLLVGENGSGKTTILKVILGLITYHGTKTIHCRYLS
ncbi:MAG: ATP-binding cassette domain-containing protein [Bacilli bacterium]|nr:ATP-binding cassette domain-containing protein [Bacilli bacterium]